MPRARKGAVCAVAVIALLTPDTGLAADPAAHPDGHPGSPSRHDPIVPGYGNGGYDVVHYGIHLRYNPDTGRLRGQTRITAIATSDLSRLHLDFALGASTVTVDGRRATARTRRVSRDQFGRELIVRPSRSLRDGERFSVVVGYDAHPFDVKFQGYSSWSHTPTGMTDWNEPESGPQWWYPSDDYPDDKATYDVTVTTPKGQTAVSNGRLVARRAHGGQVTVHWRSSAPMATYLSFLTIGRYDVRRLTTRDGIPAYLAVERGGGPLVRRARRYVSRTPSIIRFFERRFGPYPFPVTGAIVERTKYPTAFETQTRVTYAAAVFTRDVSPITNVVHETAHQWFGDDVTACRWSDIWLAEGFASYAQWLWSAAHHRGTVEHHFAKTYERRAKGSPWWQTPVVDKVDSLPLQAYRRGAMSLEALRNVVGSHPFFTILRTYLDRYRHGCAMTDDFIEVAESIAAQPLDRFFRVWLDAKQRPRPTVRNGFPTGFPRSVV
jgi:aminopeptidase N